MTDEVSRALQEFERVLLKGGKSFERSENKDGKTYRIDQKTSVQIAFLMPNVPGQDSLHKQEAEPDLRIGIDQLARSLPIVISKINSLFGESQRIHGRQTKVIDLSKPEMEAFLTANHIHGKTNSKHKYGLQLKGELVAVFALGKKCPIDRGNEKWQSMEIIRFCNKIGYTVVGGLDKLIKHTLKNHQPDDLMTTIDLDWGSGSGFERLGFKEERILPPKTFFLQDLKSLRSHDETLPWKILNSGSRVMLLKLKPHG